MTSTCIGYNTMTSPSLNLICPNLLPSLLHEKDISSALPIAQVEEFHNRTALQDDKAFLESMAIIDFLAHQIREGNYDLTSPKMIEQTCIYILIHIYPHD